jgi:hypothetical protein
MVKERTQEEIRSDRRRRRKLAGKVGVAMGAAGLLLFIVGIRRHPGEEGWEMGERAPDAEPDARS